MSENYENLLNFEEISKQDLIEMYEQIKDFSNFLESQINNYEEKEK